jgi:hypothetical protein
MSKRQRVKGRKARNVFFTINFADAEVTDLLTEEFPEWVKYMVWQLECGEEGVMHYQGYMECQGQKYFHQIKEIPGFERSHLEVRRGNQAEAVNYCMKEDTRVDGPWEYGTKSEVGGKGHRSDLLEIQGKLMQGISLKRLADEHFSSCIRYGRAFKDYKRTHTAPRDFKSIVILIVGPSGKQKSTLARLIGKALGSVYQAPMPKGSGMYYDDYDGEDVFFLDEFDGNRMRPTEFNMLCDEGQHILPVHGGAGHQFVSKFILICSNYLPSEWWKKRNAGQVRQTTRRIDFVFKRGFDPNYILRANRPGVLQGPAMVAERAPQVVVAQAASFSHLFNRG